MFKKRDCMQFVAEDPFNPGNRLEGDLIQSRDAPEDFYGAMYIKSVNGEKVEPYVIKGTPKVRYPFDKGSGNYQFPSATEIRSYLKYDGTNIYAYKYHDKKGEEFISFKIRLFPFVGSYFIPMWQKMLKKYPIKQLFGLNPHLAGFSFELYGYLNPHLFKYDVDLDTVLLFARDKEDNIVPNEEIKSMVPKAPLVTTISDNYVWNYQQAQERLGEQLNLITERHPETEDPFYGGEEGNMWYLRSKKTGKWVMLKCKPNEIEKIHWSNFQSSLHIDKPVIRATIINVLEAHETLTLDVVKTYLKEEFTEAQITASLKRITTLMEKQNQYVALRRKIEELIIEHDIDLNQELTKIVSDIRPYISKRESRMAFRAVKFLVRMNQIME